jgi:hypothetical protein
MKTSLLAWFVAFITPLLPLTLLVGLFIIFDTYMGRKAAAKDAITKNINPREAVTSKKTREGLTKKFLIYNLVLLTIYLADLYILGDPLQEYSIFPFTITRIGVIVLCWIEYDSIDEKYYNIKGITLTEIIKDKINKLKKLLTDFITFKFLK